MRERNGETDSLVAESERLRRELLKTAARLEVFSRELMDEARQLKEEAAAQAREAEDDERGDDSGGAEAPGPGPGQPIDHDGGGTDGGG